MDQNVAALMEMGIEHDVAVSALQETGGDLEAALNSIFNNDSVPVETQGIMETHRIQENEVGFATAYPVPTGRPEDNYMNSEHRDTKMVYSDSDSDSESESDSNSNSNSNSDSAKHNGTGTNNVDDDDDDENSDSSSSLEPSQYRSIDDLIPQQLKGDMDSPTVVIPSPVVQNHIYYCALFALFISINLPQFFIKDKEGQPPLEQLLFSPDWFNDIDKEPEDEPLAVLRDQLLKLIVVQNSRNHSMRSFVTSKMFNVDLTSMRQQTQDALETNPEFYHLYEILPSFIKSISNISSEQTNLFISSAIHTVSKEEAPKESLLSLLHFLPEEYEANLYRMFNVLLYPDEDSDSESEMESDSGEGTSSENSLKEIAPVLTIVFNEAEAVDENIRPSGNGVDIPLEFYPQLYSKSCKDQLIKHIIAKRKIAQNDLRRILKEISALKSYQGKDILSFVNSTLDYLTKDKDESGLIEQISKLKDELTKKKTRKMNDYKAISEKLHKEWNIQNPEISIIDNAKKMNLIDEPYLLTMAVVSPFFYLIRKRSGDWFEVRFNPFNESQEKIHVTKCLDTIEVTNHIRNSTKLPSVTPLMFVYCKQSLIIDDEEINSMVDEKSILVDFFKQDQVFLQNFQDPIKEDGSPDRGITL
ncbi:Rup1p [Nakaseomyces bracarensis]|uniref:Rup1p n=1 Tax=Nakaseomyces bracarensis TaxID=273131 RepID=UPI003871A6A7